MDLHSATPETEDFKSLPGVNPLSVSSGNAQSVSAETRDGIENHQPLPTGDLCAIPLTESLQFSVPAAKLGSTDIAGSDLDRKSRRRLAKVCRSKHVVDPERPYLQHPKYLGYRSRPRQDLGKDGMPIWSDKIENAFQNALVNIKPMGRKKCSQRGRPYGRNMLIAEWIFRETGEVRLRKQVSSHIQVLNRFLSGIPEWDRLIKPCDDKDGAAAEGHKFYHNSIEHMVNEYKALGSHMLRRGGIREDLTDDNDDGPGTLAGYLESYSVQRLSFDMWVSPQDNLECAIHTYTQLQSVKLMATPLENLIGWRQSFPHLQPIIDAWSTSNHCELISLDASFRLMEDFAPRYSKLGIGLEIDLMDSKLQRSAALKELTDWSCTTRLYQDGQQVGSSIDEECRVSGPGNVKPFFQSKWWAETFTTLTEAKKLAEDSNDPAAVALADEQSRNFFQSLSIMQEISTVRYKDYSSFDEKPRPKLSKRVVILLWKFSQVAHGSEGVTTWQTLIAQPDRLVEYSPLPPGSGMELPSLAMDNMVDDGPGTLESLDGHSNFLLQDPVTYGLYSEVVDEDLCQDRFMAFKPDQIIDFDHLQPSFELPTGPNLDLGNNLGPENGTFNISHHDLQTTTEANLFELPVLAGQEIGLPVAQYGRHDLDDGSQESPGCLRRHPLTRFDLKTHQLLQQQLGRGSDRAASQSQSPHAKSKRREQDNQLWARPEDLGTLTYALPNTQLRQKKRRLEPEVDDHSWTHLDEHDEVLRSALLAVSANGDLRPQTPETSHRLQFEGSRKRQQDDPLWMSPLAFRPVLQTHHSFPGLGSSEPRLPRHDDGDGSVLEFEHGLGITNSHPQIEEDQMNAPLAVQTLGSIGMSTAPARPFVRAHSEPDSAAAAMATDPGLDFVSGAHHHNVVARMLNHQTEHQIQSKSQNGLEIGDSIVEAKMEGVPE